MQEILKNRAVLSVEGLDAMKFLNSLTTNDLKALSYCYCYMLSSSGRFLADCFISKISESEFFIDINENLLIQIKAHLAKYKMRSKIEVKDLSDSYQILYSKKNGEYKDPRYNKLGYRSIISKSQAIEIEKDTYLKDKYEFSIVDGFEDLIYDKSIPIEYGAEEMQAISYTKGCYLGQEIISRAKYQGVIRKKLFKIEGKSNQLIGNKGDDVIANGKKIGVLCSIYKNIGIGLVNEQEYYTIQDAEVTINRVVVDLSVPDWRK